MKNEYKFYQPITETEKEGQGSPNRGNRLQVSGIFISLKQQEETNNRYFPPHSPRYCFLLYTNLKGGSLKILSCHDDTWFHLKLAIRKPWVNQCIFLMEMFVFQFSSVTHTCLTLCDPMNCSMSGLPVHHQLPESTQNHVQRVIDAIQPSHPLSSPSPPALSLS